MSDATASVNNYTPSRRRLFVPLDVNYADDPKILRVGPDSELVYLRSLALAKRIASDGRIDRRHLERLGCDLFDFDGNPIVERCAKDLESEGLWLRDGDGWLIAAWDRWNLTADEMEERKQGKARGAAAANHKRWHVGRGVVDPDCELCSHELSQSESQSESHPVAYRDREEVEIEISEDGLASEPPTAPAEEAKPKTKRGTRVPDPFDVTDPMVAWVLDRCPGLDWERETEKFINYWAAAPGQRGVKLDWIATWRKWMLESSDRKAVR